MRDSRSLLTLSVGIGICPLAAGQTINIDVGNYGPFGVPSNAYGAAAGVPGFWNEVNGQVWMTTGPLLDVTGAATPVTITFSSGFNYYYDNPLTMGDDEALLDDISDAFYVNGPPNDVTIAGLADGVYDVYTYALAPDGTFLTGVDVALSASGPQVVGGTWSGTHVFGVSYALHTDVVISGGNDLVVRLDQVGPYGSLNGLQIVDIASASIGTNYCTPGLPNSTGNPAAISATGSQLVGSNHVTLTASRLPPGQFGYFLAGQMQGASNPPGSQGILCLAGNIGRYDTVTEIIQGPTGSLMLELGSIPVNPPTAVQAGDTWNFQCWYRDSNPGATSNLTDGVSVLFH